MEGVEGLVKKIVARNSAWRFVSPRHLGYDDGKRSDRRSVYPAQVSYNWKASLVYISEYLFYLG